MNRKLLRTGIVGTVIAAVCCFTPVLVVVFGILGLSSLVVYLDVVLFPILGIFVLIIVLGIIKS